ncbi:unnamed protein product [Somion occarium]|uniref:F-box domain-containing protein n=1 Tax=Somion occarium TaxID=3059160 RepID=A0ABP1DDG6_9APHY
MLYQELIDCIIDFLHADRDALSNCSLVCRDWLDPSRYHLLSSVCIKVNSPPPSFANAHTDALNAFLACLDISTFAIGGFIRSLTITAVGDFFRVKRTVVEVHSLVGVLKRLPRLREMRIFRIRFQAYTLDGASEPFISLKKLHLDQVALKPLDHSEMSPSLTFLHYFSHIGTLHIVSPSLDVEMPDGPVYLGLSSKAQAHKLMTVTECILSPVWEDIADVFATVRHVLDTQSLQSITLSLVSPSQIVDAGQFVKDCAGLESITINIDQFSALYVEPDDWAKLNLSQAYIRMVTVSSGLVTNGDSPKSLVNWGYSTRIIASLSSPPALRKVNVRLICHNMRNRRSSTISDICSAVEDLPWDMLQASVMQLSRSVVELKVEVQLMRGIRVDGEKTGKAMNKCIDFIKGELQMKRIGIEVQFRVTNA